MEFRIREYKIANANNNKFFVQVAEHHREKIWWIFYRRVVNWKTEAEAETMTDALQCVQEIKNAQPIDHFIK